MPSKPGLSHGWGNSAQCSYGCVTRSGRGGSDERACLSAPASADIESMDVRHLVVSALPKDQRWGAPVSEATMVAIRPMAQCGEFCDGLVLTCQTTPFSPPPGPATGSYTVIHPKSNFQAMTPNHIRRTILALTFLGVLALTIYQQMEIHRLSSGPAGPVPATATQPAAVFQSAAELSADNSGAQRRNG
jgi:hypothetical protein